MKNAIGTGGVSLLKESKQKSRRVRNAALILLLALICVGGVELAFCRHFAPEHYQQITAPVRQGLEEAAGVCRSAYLQAARLWRSCRDYAVQTARRWAEARAERRRQAELEAAIELASQASAEPVPLSALPEIPQGSAAITDMVEKDGRQILTGGLADVVYFNQGEEPWASQPYGRDHIGGYGCGPTAMARAVACLTDIETAPATMAQWAAEQGYWASKSGSYLSIVEGTARAYGLEAAPLEQRTPEALRDALLSGKMLVALMGPGHFTNNGHFILLRGVTLSGTVLVADPNSTDRSLCEWDPQLILDELSSNHASGGPLWTVCLPQE